MCQVLLTSLSECITPLFVVKRMKSVLDKVINFFPLIFIQVHIFKVLFSFQVKAPVAHSYYLEWLKDAIKDFGYGINYFIIVIKLR